MGLGREKAFNAMTSKVTVVGQARGEFPPRVAGMWSRSGPPLSTTGFGWPPDLGFGGVGFMEYFCSPSVNSGTTSTTTAPPAWAVIEQLFDHVPDTVFFVKDRAGRYLATNQTLVERCGLRTKAELLGKAVTAVFPRELAERFAAQDEAVLRSGRAIIDRLELHWYPRRRTGWCLTTKLPLRDGRGEVVGLVGISRDLREPGDARSLPAAVAPVLEYLETHYAEPVSPRSLAQRAGLSPVRFARLIKRLFRLSPVQLIAQTRLAAASRLLRETGQQVADIAVACGFYDHSAFTRAFKSATGQTPTQFRGGRRSAKNGSPQPPAFGPEPS